MGDPTNKTVTMVDPQGVAHEVDAEQVPQAIDQLKFHIEGAGEHKQRIESEAKSELYGSVPGKIATGIAGVERGATLGLSDVAMRAMFGEGGGHALDSLRQENPKISFGSELAGALITAIPTGGESLLGKLPGASVGRLGARIAETGEGAGALTKIARGAAGGTAEGMIYGGGSGLTDLALDDHPLTAEHIASTLSSHMLYGGVVGAGAGTLAKTAELGLGRAKSAIDDFAAGREAQAAVPDDLATMDIKQLRAARADEVKAIGERHAASVADLEAARIPQRKTLADDIGAFRREVKEADHYLTTDGIKMPAEEGKLATSEIGKISVKANSALDQVLNNPIGLAKNPGRALDALQRQENAMAKLMEREPELRAAYATSERGAERAAALDTVPAMLEKNRALQQRIEELQAPIKLEKPATSAKLDSIDHAIDTLAAGKGEKTVAEQMLQGSVFAGVTHAAHAVGAMVPGIGWLAATAAPFIGAKAAKLVTSQVFQRMGKAAGEQALRAAKAATGFIESAQGATRAATPLATRVLANVRYAPPQQGEPPPPQRGQSDLQRVFMARAAEVRSQVMPGPNGQAVMRPDARAAVADRLKGIAAGNPVLADKIETVAARKLELLANALPRKPDVLAAMLGPDRWHPDEMAMRGWARLAAAVEDPAGILERAAHGKVTPEDARAMQQVYPEMLNAFTQQIMGSLPNLKKPLPYERRLSLSMLTGAPVDPAFDPRIMSVLQGTFTAEPGTAGGTQAPRAVPQFGSISKSVPEPTPAQKRAG